MFYFCIAFDLPQPTCNPFISMLSPCSFKCYHLPSLFIPIRYQTTPLLHPHWNVDFHVKSVLPCFSRLHYSTVLIFHTYPPDHLPTFGWTLRLEKRLVGQCQLQRAICKNQKLFRHYVIIPNFSWSICLEYCSENVIFFSLAWPWPMPMPLAIAMVTRKMLTLDPHTLLLQMIQEAW